MVFRNSLERGFGIEGNLETGTGNEGARALPGSAELVLWNSREAD